MSTDCPHCGQAQATSAEFCPHCLGELRGGREVAGAQLVPQPHTPEEVSPVLPCHDHPDRPTVGTCSRCGTFVCVSCAPDFAFAPQRPCLKCEATLAVSEAPLRSRRTLRAAGASGVLYGLIVGSLTGAGGDFALIGAMVALPYLALGGLLLLTCWRWVGYVLFVFQGLGILIFSGWRWQLFLGLWALSTLALLIESDKLRRGEPLEPS